VAKALSFKDIMLKKFFWEDKKIKGTKKFNFCAFATLYLCALFN